jgi:hypothetical protein
VLALLVGLGLRVWEAAESSLWLDELHTLSHAAQPTAAALMESVRREVHTPLFFLAVQALGDWSAGAWLRVVPVLSSLLVAWPLWSLARSASRPQDRRAPEADHGVPVARTALLAVALYAWVPYQVHWAAELRPYTWVALFAAGAVWSAFSTRGPAPLRLGLFFLCVLLGLYTHRIMALAVFALGVARLSSWRRRGPLHLGWLVLAGALAVAPFVAWLVGFAGEATEARFDYQEQAGGYTLRPALVKEVLALPVRVLVPYMGALGEGWATLARAGALAFFGALGLGAVLRLAQRGRIGAHAFPLRGLALYALACFLVVTALSIWTWDRVPLQYYAPLAWLLPLFLAELLGPIEGPAARAARGLALAGALALGVAQAGGSCTEDVRRAVAEARALGGELESAGRSPIYTSLLSQPESFSQTLAYRAYAPDLAVEEPDRVPALDPARPVVLLRRGFFGPGHPAWDELLAGRRVAREIDVDAYLTVFLLEPEAR